MAGEQEDTQGPGSAIPDATEGQEEWEVEGTPTETAEASETQAAEQTPTETPTEEAPPEETPPEEGQLEKPQEAGEEQEVQPSAKEQELTDEVAQLRAEIENTNQMATFYQQQYNDVIGTQPPGTQKGVTEQGQVTPGQTTPQTPQGLPEGVLPPDQWENQNQMAGYMDHRATETAQTATTQMMEEQITPVFKRAGAEIAAMQDSLVKFVHSDYDKVVEPLLQDLFTMAPDGKVIGVKNQALLNYFREQPFPQMAMYKHGLAKQAPQKIKEGRQTAIKETVKNIMGKPKAPTQPITTSVPKDAPGLDWDSSPDQAEEYLDKEGLL